MLKVSDPASVVALDRWFTFWFTNPELSFPLHIALVFL